MVTLYTFSRRNEQVDLLLALVGPHLDDGRPELEVGLVHLLGRPHLDAEDRFNRKHLCVSSGLRFGLKNGFIQRHV